jgi:thiol-disulfide isomerase/thioredoxin
VLLNIWATWCGPCRAEMPSLDRLQGMHQGDGLAVLAVSVDDDGSAAVRRFFQQSGVRNLTLYLDAGGATARAFGASAIPTTLLIDRNGNVVGSLVGAMQWDSPDALALIRHYLEG